MHTNHGPPCIYLTLCLVVLLSCATCLVSSNLYGANESEQCLPLNPSRNLSSNAVKDSMVNFVKGKINKSYYGKIINSGKLHSFGNMMATYYTFFLKNYVQVADNSKSVATTVSSSGGVGVDNDRKTFSKTNIIFVSPKATRQLDTLETGMVESKSAVVSLEDGIASWYGLRHHGKVTASGEVCDMNELTAAHRDLPFNTLVRVINLSNGKSVIVRINDRGPFVKGRIIDLSKEAARRLNMIYSGTSEVKLEILSSDS